VSTASRDYVSEPSYYNMYLHRDNVTADLSTSAGVMTFVGS